MISETSRLPLRFRAPAWSTSSYVWFRATSCGAQPPMRPRSSRGRVEERYISILQSNFPAASDVF